MVMNTSSPPIKMSSPRKSPNKSRTSTPIKTNRLITTPTTSPNKTVTRLQRQQKHQQLNENGGELEEMDTSLTEHKDTMDIDSNESLSTTTNTNSSNNNNNKPSKPIKFTKDLYKQKLQILNPENTDSEEINKIFEQSIESEVYYEDSNGNIGGKSNSFKRAITSNNNSLKDEKLYTERHGYLKSNENLLNKANYREIDFSNGRGDDNDDNGDDNQSNHSDESDDSDLNKETAPWVKPSSYIIYQEKSSEDLDNEVEYDMDSEDEQWLKEYNQSNHQTFTEDDFEFIIDRLEKETFNYKQSVGSDMFPHFNSEEAGDVCAVCFDGTSDDTNQIVYCDGCDIAVHQECYSIVLIPEGHWFCQKCESPEKDQITCKLCGKKNGAFKQTLNEEWVHLVCINNIPELMSVMNKKLHTPRERLGPLGLLSLITKQRYKLTCTICKEKVGACIQCRERNCSTSFHPYCIKVAQKNRYEENLNPHIIFCNKHFKNHKNNLQQQPQQHQDSSDINKIQELPLSSASESESNDNNDENDQELDSDDEYLKILPKSIVNNNLNTNNNNNNNTTIIDTNDTNNDDSNSNETTPTKKPKPKICASKPLAILQLIPENPNTLERPSDSEFPTSITTTTTTTINKSPNKRITTPLKSTPPIISAPTTPTTTPTKAIVPLIKTTTGITAKKAGLISFKKVCKVIKYPHKFLNGVYDFWVKKRISRSGLAIIKRFQPSILYSLRPTLQTQDPGVNTLDHFNQMIEIRKDLERVRTILELVRKREKCKRNFVFNLRTFIDSQVIQDHYLHTQIITILNDIELFFPFCYPVTEDIAPNYFKIVKEPMSFSLILQKLNTYSYDTDDEFWADFRLISSNAKLYNNNKTNIHKAASTLERLINQLEYNLPNNLSLIQLSNFIIKTIEQPKKIQPSSPIKPVILSSPLVFTRDKKGAAASVGSVSPVKSPSKSTGPITPQISPNKKNNNPNNNNNNNNNKNAKKPFILTRDKKHQSSRKVSFSKTVTTHNIESIKKILAKQNQTPFTKAKNVNIVRTTKKAAKSKNITAVTPPINETATLGDQAPLRLMPTRFTPVVQLAKLTSPRKRKSRSINDDDVENEDVEAENEDGEDEEQFTDKMQEDTEKERHIDNNNNNESPPIRPIALSKLRRKNKPIIAPTTSLQIQEEEEEEENEENENNQTTPSKTKKKRRSSFAFLMEQPSIPSLKQLVSTSFQTLSQPSPSPATVHSNNQKEKKVISSNHTINNNDQEMSELNQNDHNINKGDEDMNDISTTVEEQEEEKEEEISSPTTTTTTTTTTTKPPVFSDNTSLNDRFLYAISELSAADRSTFFKKRGRECKLTDPLKHLDNVYYKVTRSIYKDWEAFWQDVEAVTRHTPRKYAKFAREIQAKANELMKVLK